ncbi:hypothetical protein OF83DRAFT_1160728 [Amylostereum chailletii]|nr:hypothetical protein OF83DRAFT_1160728 [Amylostereum chailletii]
MSLVDQIVVAEKFNMGSMREEAWGKLVSRDGCLQIEEAGKLGMPLTLQLVQEREGIRTKKGFKQLQEQEESHRKEVKQLGDQLASEKEGCKTLEERCEKLKERCKTLKERCKTHKEHCRTVKK